MKYTFLEKISNAIIEIDFYEYETYKSLNWNQLDELSVKFNVVIRGISDSVYFIVTKFDSFKKKTVSAENFSQSRFSSYTTAPFYFIEDHQAIDLVLITNIIQAFVLGFHNEILQLSQKFPKPQTWNLAYADIQKFNNIYDSDMLLYLDTNARINGYFDDIYDIYGIVDYINFDNLQIESRVIFEVDEHLMLQKRTSFDQLINSIHKNKCFRVAFKIQLIADLAHKYPPTYITRHVCSMEFFDKYHKAVFWKEWIPNVFRYRSFEVMKKGFEMTKFQHQLVWMSELSSACLLPRALSQGFTFLSEEEYNKFANLTSK